MAKRTKKVGITGKYGTRYGASLRKVIKKMLISKRASYLCSFCGKTSVKRQAAGIWKCKSKTCGRSVAGACWIPCSGLAIKARTDIQRVRVQKLRAED
eukprot:NODE_27924_length_495_cov_3.627717.p2 GENE.NODE_27924_length_495_cov_3.627717~~NODE_27924_length_495_cov_3.627717.p2  ORF type:complete len:98 (-),score=24.10 NODE_27924_length_495_cov_3.627717:103-396(-)